MAKTKEPSKSSSSAKKPEKTAQKTPSQKTAKETSKPDEPPEIIRYCSFCRKPSDEVMALIAGPNHIFICDNCIEVCVAILLDDENPNKNNIKIWRQRITDRLANPKKFNISTIDESQKSRES